MKLATPNILRIETFHEIQIISVHRHMYRYVYVSFCLLSAWLCIDFDLLRLSPLSFQKKRQLRHFAELLKIRNEFLNRVNYCIIFLGALIHVTWKKNSFCNSIFVNAFSGLRSFDCFENTTTILSKFITESRSRRVYLVVTWM